MFDFYASITGRRPVLLQFSAGIFQDSSFPVAFLELDGYARIVPSAAVPVFQPAFNRAVLLHHVLEFELPVMGRPVPEGAVGLCGVRPVCDRGVHIGRGGNVRPCSEWDKSDFLCHVFYVCLFASITEGCRFYYNTAKINFSWNFSTIHPACGLVYAIPYYPLPADRVGNKKPPRCEGAGIGITWVIMFSHLMCWKFGKTMPRGVRRRRSSCCTPTPSSSSRNAWSPA